MLRMYATPLIVLAIVALVSLWGWPSKDKTIKHADDDNDF